MDKPLRILHFSDFHLNGDKLKQAEHVLEYMIKALSEINMEKGIDVIIFSGDFLEKGGEGFQHDILSGLNVFKEKVLTRITSSLGLPLSRVIFTPGNHDIDRSKIDEFAEDGIELRAKSNQDIISLIEGKTSHVTGRAASFKEFEKKYYEDCRDIEYTHSDFNSQIILTINELNIGFTSVNTIWRCGVDDTNKIVMGINQLTENPINHKDLDLKIAVTHYPIDHLKEFERKDITNVLANNYDLFFTGHTHRGDVQPLLSDQGNVVWAINAAGTLSKNIYEKDSHFKNAFQIIDYDRTTGCKIIRYLQVEYTDFLRDRMYGENGILSRPVLSPQQISLISRQNEEQEKERRLEIFKSKIYPFIPVKEFIEASPRLMSSEFITCPAIDRIKTQLVDQSQKTLRLMALSGMGKTRIIAETFYGQYNVFYSNSSNCANSISAFIELDNPITLIVDNCEKERARHIQKLIDESGKNIRLITVYNVLTPEEKRVSASVLELNYEDTVSVVETMIDNEDLLKDRPEIKVAIKERSGGIPYMALIMIEGYKKNKNLKVEKIDDILSTLLEGDKSIERFASKSMEALSLFEPLGYKDNYSDEYDWVCNTPVIHHLSLDIESSICTINDTVREFLSRQLIEEDGPCIRIRPRPLAEWLTERWLEKNGETMSDVFNALNSAEDSLKRRLTRAMSRRFQEMTDSVFAHQLYAKLNKLDNGSFHNERVAFTEVGSRLLLSMSTVNPQDVSSNIFSLLKRNTKDWIKENIKYETRRNLIYTLERTVSFSDAFKNSALALAKLANAENEDFGNNSNGDFNQLFHVFLSGTSASLDDRFSVILYLRENLKENGNLVLSAINNALYSHGFSKISPSSQLPKDYEPTPEEIQVYWTKVIELLKEIVQEDGSFLDKAAEMISNHAMGLISYESELLFDIIGFISEQKNFDWPAMRESLSNIYYWKNMTDEKIKTTLKYWMDKLEPKLFFGKLKAHIQDIHNGRIEHKSFEEEVDIFRREMEPFALEFINKRIYETSEFINICQDNSSDWFWLIRAINPIIQTKEKSYELIDGLSKAVQKLPCNVESRFIMSLLAQVPDGQPLIPLRDEWYKSKRFRLASSLSGIIENKFESQYDHMQAGYASKDYDNFCFNNYLANSIIRHGFNDIVDFAIQMLNDNIDRIEVVYPYLISRLRFHIKDIDENTLTKVENLLIQYEFSDYTNALNRDVVDFMGDLLQQHNRPEFAVSVHKLIVKTTSTTYLINKPFDHIYFSLLPKYENVLLPIVLNDLAAEDERVLFYHAMRMNLGSGFGSGAGPLFQCNEDRIKEICLSSSPSLAVNLAQMCPVYNYSEEGKVSGLSDFFLWLCDHFGDEKDMLDAFSSNMGTFSFCGNEISAMYASRIPLFEPLLSHSEDTVRSWAQRQIDSLKAQHDYEKGNEDYNKAIYGNPL